MSAHSVKNIEQGAILLANDLRTGFTVYLLKNGEWSSNWEDAWIVRNETEADEARAIAAQSANANDVMDPYLVDTTQEGSPTHIREHLRTTGPSVDYKPTFISPAR